MAELEGRCSDQSGNPVEVRARTRFSQEDALVRQAADRACDVEKRAPILKEVQTANASNPQNSEQGGF